MRIHSAAIVALLAGLPAAAQDAFVEHNRVLYRVQKDPLTGERTYSADGRTFTHGQLAEHLAAQQPRKLTAAAEQALASARAAPLDLILVLRNQPAAPIAREVWAQVQPAADALAAELRQLAPAPLARVSLPPHMEQLAVIAPQGPEQVRARMAAAQAYDDLVRDARQEIFRRIQLAVQGEQGAVAAVVVQLGGQVRARVTSMNILGVRLPASQAARLAADPRIAVVDLDHPGTPELSNSALALGVNTGFWANNVNGGVADAGVLDTGVQMNHPALLAHPFLSNMGSGDTSTHGTHVAGIMVSTDSFNRGMAWGGDKIVFALAGSITTSMPGMDYIASTGEPEACNYSFGNGTANTADYTPTDQFFDGVIDTYGYIVSKSTGNGGFGTGTPTITHPAPAYNLLACASIYDQNSPDRADDRISSYSSRGPTLAGRKKPDIASPGENIMSCNKNWTPTSLWVSMSGTSMAAPHIGGSILLLNNLGVPNITAAKAVLINTADAINDNNTSATTDDVFVQGSLWNRRYGWGYANLSRAYLHGMDHFNASVSAATPQARFKLYTGQMFASEKATLAWRRHVAYNGSTYPTQIEGLTDLDLFAYRAGDGAQVASSTSAIDNVEQLHVSADGVVVLKVKAVGALDPQVASEPFALATQENFTAAQGPAFTPAFSAPGGIQPGAAFQLTLEVVNGGDVPAHNVTVELLGQTVLIGSNPVNVGTILPGQPGQAVWTIQAANTAGAQPLSASVSSVSYGETFAAQAQGSYSVGGECYPNCDQSTAQPILNVADFTCFLQRYAAGEPWANCDQNSAPPVLNVQDFTCFLQRYAAGCP